MNSWWCDFLEYIDEDCAIRHITGEIKDDLAGLDLLVEHKMQIHWRDENDAIADAVSTYIEYCQELRPIPVGSSHRIFDEAEIDRATECGILKRREAEDYRAHYHNGKSYSQIAKERDEATMNPVKSRIRRASNKLTKHAEVINDANT